MFASNPRDTVIATGYQISTWVLMSLHDSVCDVSVLVNSIYSPIIVIGAGQCFLISVCILYYSLARFFDFTTPAMHVVMNINLLYAY